jgi:hypothetical protein
MRISMAPIYITTSWGTSDLNWTTQQKVRISNIIWWGLWSINWELVCTSRLQLNWHTFSLNLKLKHSSNIVFGLTWHDHHIWDVCKPICFHFLITNTLEALIDDINLDIKIALEILAKENYQKYRDQL